MILSALYCYVFILHLSFSTNPARGFEADNSVQYVQTKIGSIILCTFKLNSIGYFGFIDAKSHK